MSDVTWFGWLYLALTAVGAMAKIWQIDRPRPPVDRVEAIVAFVFSGLMTWGLFAVGVKS